MSERAPLLLLPGLLCDVRFWQAQINGLSDISDPRVVSYGLADSIEAMASCALEHAPRQFVVAGHSMGGRVALEVYRHAPERVTKLALFCTDYRAPASELSARAEADEREEWLEIARTRGMRGFAQSWLPEIVAPARLSDAPLMDAVVEMFARHPIGVLAAQTRAGLTRPDYTDLLPQIACPTLVCAGARDSFRPIGPHREMAAQIPDSKLIVVEGSGHMIAMEQLDEVTDIMRKWLCP